MFRSPYKGFTPHLPLEEQADMKAHQAIAAAPGKSQILAIQRSKASLKFAW